MKCQTSTYMAQLGTKGARGSETAGQTPWVVLSRSRLCNLPHSGREPFGAIHPSPLGLGVTDFLARLWTWVWIKESQAIYPPPDDSVELPGMLEELAPLSEAWELPCWECIFPMDRMLEVEMLARPHPGIHPIGAITPV